jgi:AraC family transcriptional regulator of adaptative response/methylated-DNA-[protein]-cysteine methyltransferase
LPINAHNAAAGCFAAASSETDMSSRHYQRRRGLGRRAAPRPRFDGRFVTGVLTTGIYCRPSCAGTPSGARQRSLLSPTARMRGTPACAVPALPARRRRARRAGGAAAHQGDQGAEAPLPLASSAGGRATRRAHFQRVFTRLTGLSPAAYARALREERAREALAEGESVTGRDLRCGVRERLAVLRFDAGETGHGAVGVGQGWCGGDDPLGSGRELARADARRGDRQGRVPPVVRRGREELERLFPQAELVEAERTSPRCSARGRGGRRPGERARHPGRRARHRVPGAGVAGAAQIRRRDRSYAEIAAAAGNPKRSARPARPTAPTTCRC